jgi:hypothetical protein
LWHETDREIAFARFKQSRRLFVNVKHANAHSGRNHAQA